MYQQPGLGLSLSTNPVTQIMTGLNQIESFFGLNSSDPTRDQQRIDRINFAFSAAMSGDQQQYPLLSGLTGAAYLAEIATNKDAAGNVFNPPVYGSQIAYRYAQAKYAEFRARVAAGTVGSVLVGQSNIPTTVVGAIQRAVSSPIILGGVVVAAYLLTKRRRGR